MSTKKLVVEKKKLNVPALISLLLVLLVPFLLLIPWYRIFLLRSDRLSTLMIHILGLFAIGLIMLVFGVLSLVAKRKMYKGRWMGIVGMILGLLLVGTGGFFIVDYLLRAGV